MDIDKDVRERLDDALLNFIDTASATIKGKICVFSATVTFYMTDMNNLDLESDPLDNVMLF